MKKITMSIHLYVIGADYTITDPAVYEQMMGHKTIKWVASGVEYIVPFHAVVKAEITRSSETVEAPADAFCKEEA